MRRGRSRAAVRYTNSTAVAAANALKMFMRHAQFPNGKSKRLHTPPAKRVQRVAGGMCDPQRGRDELELQRVVEQLHDAGPGRERIEQQRSQPDEHSGNRGGR